MASLFWLDTHCSDTLEYIYFGAVCRLGRGYSGGGLYCDHRSICVAAYERATRLKHRACIYFCHELRLYANHLLNHPTDRNPLHGDTPALYFGRSANLNHRQYHFYVFEQDGFSAVATDRYFADGTHLLFSQRSCDHQYRAVWVFGLYGDSL